MSFQNMLNNFLKNLEALDLFIEAQDNLIKNPEKKETTFKNQEEIKTTIKIFEKMIDLLENKDDDVKQFEFLLENVNKEVETLGVEFSRNEKYGDETDRIKIGFTNENIAKSFTEVIRLGDLTKRQKELVYRTSLTNVMIYFENLISGIIKQRLKSYPNSFNPNDKTIKYSELIEFDSFADALDHLIDNEVVSIMYGGFKSWVTYLNKSGVKTKIVDNFTEEINEAHNRRNLFVHNDGIINSIYLNKVNAKFTDGLEKGKTIHISEEYIKRVIEIVKKYGTLLLLESWKTFNATERDQRLDVCEDLAYESLKSEHWDFAKDIYKFINEETDNYGTKIRAQINLWLCEKQLGNYDTIKEDIKAFDLSGLKTYFHLCVSSLLEDNDKFFELLELEPHELVEDQLREWPILSFVRNDKRMEKYLSIDINKSEVSTITS